MSAVLDRKRQLNCLSRFCVCFCGCRNICAISAESYFSWM